MNWGNGMKKLLFSWLMASCCMVIMQVYTGAQPTRSKTVPKSNTIEDTGEPFTQRIQEVKKKLEAQSAEPQPFSKESYAKLKDDLTTTFKSIAKNVLMRQLYERTWNRLKDLANRMPTTGGTNVRVDTALSANERLFLSKRMETVRNALEQFLDTDLSDRRKITDNDLKIAFVASGGGYRAMILTIGYLSALQQMGLYDALTYVSTLSGSSWALAPMISLNYTPQHYKEKLLNSIQNLNLLAIQNVLFKSLTNINNLVDTIIVPKYLYNQPIRSIDFYGFMLAQTLLGNDGYKYYLSDQWKILNDSNNAGKIPFPLYSAISVSKKKDNTYALDWYEFGPSEVRVGFPTEDKKVASFNIPTYEFGSEFNAGKPVRSVPEVITPYYLGPEQMLGYYLGIFGSVYSINFNKINQFVSGGMAQLSSGGFSLDSAKNYIAISAFNALQNFSKKTTENILPAQVFNFLKGYEEAPDYLQTADYLTMGDASIDYNIPARPVLWPLRNVKVLIIGDSSSNIESATELKRFFEDAYKLYGYQYTRIDTGDNKTIRFYKDLKNSKAPRVVYVNFVKDIDLIEQAKIKNKELRDLIEVTRLEQFDPVACIQTKPNNFCDAFNFNYSKTDYEQLIGISEFNMKVNIENIKRFLIDEMVKNLEDVNFPVFGQP